MKVSGTATLSASREEVWNALNDPAVLVRTIPGCQRLEAIGDDAYRMTVSAGVASIKGIYEGEVSLTEQRPLNTFVLKAAGAGGPGTVSASVLVTLSEASASSTLLSYDADAIVGGMIGGVGQRMLAGVAKKTAGEFFAAVDDVLTGAKPASAVTAPGEPGNAAHAVGSGVFTAPAPALAPPGQEFLKGIAVGAGLVLAGVIVGGIFGRRR